MPTQKTEQKGVWKRPSRPHAAFGRISKLEVDGVGIDDVADRRSRFRDESDNLRVVEQGTRSVFLMVQRIQIELWQRFPDTHEIQP